jgi:hypothetical protein
MHLTEWGAGGRRFKSSRPDHFGFIERRRRRSDSRLVTRRRAFAGADVHRTSACFRLTVSPRPIPIRQLIDAFGLPAIRRSLMAFDTRKAVLCKQRVSHPLAPTNSLRQLIDAFGLLPVASVMRGAAKRRERDTVLSSSGVSRAVSERAGGFGGRRNPWHL